METLYDAIARSFCYSTFLLLDVYSSWLLLAVSVTRHFLGLTENDGHENDGPSKLQDMKLQDMKKTDQIAMHENAGHENDGPSSMA